MPSLTVKRPVQVIAIVTEQFKKELTEELQTAADDTQRRIEQLEFQSRRYVSDLQRSDLTQAMALRQRLEGEKQKHETLRKELLDRLGEVQGLAMDSEFPRGTIEGTVEVQPGDNLFDKVGKAEIVVKDGVIVEIREP